MSIPTVVSDLRRWAQEVRSLLFIARYLDKDTGIYHPRPVDPADYLDLWDQWRSRLGGVAPPPVPDIRSEEDAHQALDAILRRLEEVFGPPPAEEVREAWGGVLLAGDAAESATDEKSSAAKGRVRSESERRILEQVAIAKLFTLGPNLSAISRETGVPRNTLREWPVFASAFEKAKNQAEQDKEERKQRYRE